MDIKIDLSKIDNETSIIADAKEVAQTAVKIVLGDDNEYVERLLINKIVGVKKQYSSPTLPQLLRQPSRTQLKESLSSAVNVTQQKALETLCEQQIVGTPRSVRLRQDLKTPRQLSSIISKSQPIMSNSRSGLEIVASNSKNIPISSDKLCTQITQRIDQNIVCPDKNILNTSHQENINSVVDEQIDLGVNQSVSSWVVNTLLQEKLNYRELQEHAEKWKNINGILALVLPIVTPVIVGLIQYYCFGNSPCSSDA